MVLKDQLYQITGKESSEHGISYGIALQASHEIYQAHFPGEPVTPGVCIIQMVKELAEEHLGVQMEIKAVKNVKFLSVLSPVEHPQALCTFEKITEEGDSCTMSVSVTDTRGETTFAKISMTADVSEVLDRNL